ncbi:HD domain-containing protein [Desulforhopalus singaporensis]|uniref:HD/PDEase domain-containing protein n=1 Tax=Desulforhopalus singaporensis TaxID=91360 RepID=A0A1H0S7U5_9BACT|nr:HD domain-containing protein [Desulforhopalus singaporensis]SDP37737.1 hypothetical protein SAMN05660330_02577 [Desulforhopalus singaporensis]
MKSNRNSKYLSSVFEGGNQNDPLEWIVFLIRPIWPRIELELIREIHWDLVSIFVGTDGDFKKTTMPYHNLRHTLMTVLATVRLFHGLRCNGVEVTEKTLLQGLLSAYFHDSGMLVKKTDTATSGSKYLKNHETRSIVFLQNYLIAKKLPAELGDGCETIIRYTAIKSDPETFKPHLREIRLAGQVVGSADILAQMADRYYLESLPLLFQEQKAGGINEYSTPIELMERTAYFYYNIALKRLVTKFPLTATAMRAHFLKQHAIDRDLYLENIRNNIRYLKKILINCRKTDCLDQHLRRKPPLI